MERDLQEIKMGRVNRFEGKTVDDLAVLHDVRLTNKSGYIHLSRDGYSGNLHRWLWTELKGPIPEGFEIDHINGIRHDCRIENLRCVPKIINARNHALHSDNSSGVNGLTKASSGRNSMNQYWVARWVDPDSGKRNAKHFSIAKLGDSVARKAAESYLETVHTAVLRPNVYSVRHGR